MRRRYTPSEQSHITHLEVLGTAVTMVIVVFVIVVVIIVVTSKALRGSERRERLVVGVMMVRGVRAMMVVGVRVMMVNNTARCTS